MGNLLLILSLAFTVQLTAVMVRRIRSVTASLTHIRVFSRELVLCAAFIVFSLAVRFDCFSPARPLFMRLIAWAAAAGSAATVILGAVIIFGGIGRGKGDAETLIVLGMALERGKPTRGLRARVRTAAAYGREHPRCVVIVSGGNATDRFPSEAAVMRGLLIADGIDDTRIVTEDKATDTRENFLFAAALTDPGESVIVVTDCIHMRRALRQARAAQFRQIIALPAPPDPVDFIADLMWEIIVEINYIVNGE